MLKNKTVVGPSYSIMWIPISIRRRLYIATPPGSKCQDTVERAGSQNRQSLNLQWKIRWKLLNSSVRGTLSMWLPVCSESDWGNCLQQTCVDTCIIKPIKTWRVTNHAFVGQWRDTHLNHITRVHATKITFTGYFQTFVSWSKHKWK